MIIKRGAIPWKVNQISKMIGNGSIKFDSILQREGDQWSKEQKSLFIHSLLTDFPVPPLFASKEEIGPKKNIYSIMDGKQRLTTMHSFLQGEYELKDIPNISIDPDEIEYFKEELQENENNLLINRLDLSTDSFDLNGLYFSDMPLSLQEDLKIQTMSIYLYPDVEFEDLEDLFYRMNNGVPLNAMQKLKAKLGQHVLIAINSLRKHGLFTEMNLSSTDVKAEKSLLYVLQTFILIEAELTKTGKMSKNSLENLDINFTASAVGNYALNLKTYSEEELKTLVEATEDGFSKLSPIYNLIPKGLKKPINLPTFTLLAYQDLYTGYEAQIDILTAFDIEVKTNLQNQRTGQTMTNSQQSIDFALNSGAGASKASKIKARTQILSQLLQ